MLGSADSTQAQCISQSKDVVESPLQIQEGKSVDSLTEDSISIEDLLLHFSVEDQVSWRCDNCASQSKNGEQIVGSGNEDDVGDTIKTYRFTILPPVLTLQLNRTSHRKGTPIVGNTAGLKISVHVRFMEYLDVEQFMDPRYDSCSK